MKSSNINIKEFTERLAAFVRQNPHLAPRAYARAAEKFREEAQHHPGEAIHYRALAARLDQLAAEAGVPEVEVETGEIVSQFSDAPGDNIVTEWDAQLNTIAKSKIDEDGRPRSELESAWIQQQDFEAAEKANTDGEPSNDAITPASARPGITLFGNTALVKYGGVSATGSYARGVPGGGLAAVQEAQVVRWDGREHEARAVTVTVINPALLFQPFNPSYLANAGPSDSGTYNVFQGTTFPGDVSNPTSPISIYRPYFHMQWGGSRGVPNELYGDVGRGCQITICASFVYVSVGMSYTPGLLSRSGAATQPGAMVLGATMGFFASGKNSKVYRTWSLDFKTGGAALIIPPFATTVEAIHAATPTNWVVNIQTINLENISTITPSQFFTSIPLPIDAYIMSVTNTSGSGDSLEIVYGLSL